MSTIEATNTNAAAVQEQQQQQQAPVAPAAQAQNPTATMTAQQQQGQLAGQQQPGQPGPVNVMPGQPGQQPMPQPVQNASLYVGDLHPSTTEHDLFSVFNQKGTVVSVRVCRDQITRQSLGYGYVNFGDQAHAERARKELNFHSINGRPIRVMPVERDPKKRRSGEGNIFITNLPPSTSSLHLRDTFEQYGEILSCKAILDRNGQCRGFGFVHFKNQKDAEHAIQDANGKEIGDGKTLRVAPFKSRRQREQDREKLKENFTNVYVKSLRNGGDEQELRALFEPYGNITQLCLKSYKLKDTEVPFGFVNFETNKSAAKCIEENEMHQRHILYVEDFATDLSPAAFVKELEGLTEAKVDRSHLVSKDGKLGGFVLFEDKSEDAVKNAVEKLQEKFADNKDSFVQSRLYAQRAQKKNERLRMLQRKKMERRRELRQKGGNLYIKNFNEDVTEEDIRKTFAPLGHVESVKIMRDREGKSRCFGFVVLSSAEEAQEAITKRGNLSIGGRPLYVAPHQTRQERQARRQQQQQQQQQQQGMYGYPQFMQGMVPFPPMMNQPGMLMYNMRSMPQFAQQNRYIQQGQIQQGQQGPRAVAQPQQQQAGARMAPGQQQQQQQQQGQQPPMGQPMPGNTADSRRMLGDKLYGLISQIDKARAPKITGMLLEFDHQRILGLLNDPAQLQAQVALAQNILSQQGQQQPVQQQQQAQQQPQAQEAQ